ncbi:MAG TPA: TonB-dependent receptor, partial [Gemmatimonadaceae bacterium]
PSLRVNVPLLFPSVNEDIERIEILLGPAAALYGPNSSSGVMHIITKSPFTSQGGTLTLDGGERSVIRGSGRYAALLGDRVGVKLSGEILRGKDWQYFDPSEPETVQRPTGEIVNGVGVRVPTPNVRDFDIEKESGEFRIDLRPRAGMEWINTYGITHAGNYIEITGANGAAQARDWTYQTMQSRMTWNRTFAQIFYNTSDAGNKDSLDNRGTYLLRTGTPIVDKSRVFSAQIQQGIDFGQRQEFIIGADYIGTDPRTGGTINGRNEDIDDVTEVGGYVHSVTHLSPKFDFVAALRFDTHSEMDEDFWSPRAAIVYKITELQNLRLTYNRAFSTPANFSFFLDLPAGTLRPTVPYDIRALGVPASGFTYDRSSTTGAGGLYMRSPFPVLGPNPAGTPAFAPNTRLDADAGLLYRTIVAGNQTAFVNALLAAGVTPQNVSTVFGALVGASPPTTVGTVLRLFNPSGVGTPAGPFATVVAPGELTDVEPLKASFNNVLELGYKGIIGDKLRLAVDLWTQKRENFITPAVNVSPNAFMDPTTLGAYIAGILTAQAQQGRVPAAAVAPLTQGFTTTLAQVPVGTVVPDQPGVDPNVALTNRTDLVFTYRNIDQSINLWGSDLAIDLSLNQLWSLIGTYSYINKTTFPEVQSGVDVLRLNAANHKGSLTTRYRNELTGWGAELRGRYVNAFPVNSGVYVGEVPVNAFLDASVSYRLPLVGRGAMISLSGTNILDNKRNSFIGVPEVGRMLMTRLQYTF